MGSAPLVIVMSMVVVPVLKPLKYQGRLYVRGQQVKAHAVDALAMARRGEVSLTRGATVAAAQVQTRSLEAESSEVVAESNAPRPRRRYRRRDMTAEGSVE